MSHRKTRKLESSEPGASFGQEIQHDWSTGDLIGHEVQSLPSTPEKLIEITEQQRIEIEDFPGAISQLISGIYPLLESDASKLILTAAVNDVIHLVERTYRLDGRSAAYSARSLFEHIINFLDVMHSPVNTSERYTSHRYVTQHHIANHRGALPLLPSKDRKIEEKRLKRLASISAPRVKESLETYGTSFKRQWAEGSLYDRAKEHEMEDGYEGYRILSSVIHGSSGSLAGITRVIGETDVHRTGPDLELASLAWIEGLTSFLALADELVEMTDAWEAKEIHGRTENLVHFWSDVRKEMQRIDNELWPSAAPIGFLSVVAFYPSGHRWYQYDGRTQTLVLANPPVPEPDLTQLMEIFSTYQPEDFGGRPMTTIYADLRVQPKSNHQPFPSSSIMPPSSHPAFRAKPEVL